MTVKHNDFVSKEIKLSAGNITRRATKEKNVVRKMLNNDPHSCRYNTFFEPITQYMHRCFADCYYQSGNIKIKGEKCPAGYCTFTTGRCVYDDLPYIEKPKGFDTRVIIKKEQL